ncbi:MFS transporter [Lentzea sp. CA-135723]|uniref:MFS transporter n=1 Tax=Lentzea sp. CA-135723 TaxID=3239950 RepID=UPI003D8E11B3
MVQTDRRTERAFGALVAACSASAFGNYLNLVALSLFTWQVSGSAGVTGAVMALRLGSGFVSGFVAGRVLLPRRWVMVGADLAQASAMVALVVWPELGVLCLVVVVMGAGNTFFTVALRCSVPEVVGPGRLAQANGRLVAGRSAGTVLGFAGAGVVVPAAGVEVAFLINAASFLVCALVVGLLPVGLGVGRPAVRGRVRSGVVPQVVLGMLVVRGADALGSASHNVALPVFASSAVFMSVFWTAWAVGTFSAHRLLRRWAGRVGARAFAASTCLMSVAFVAAFSGVPVVGLVVVTFVAGVADGLTEISYVSRIQALPEEVRGRVFGVSASVEAGGFAAGMLVSAGLLEVLPPLVVVSLLHGVAFATAATFLLASKTLRSS